MHFPPLSSISCQVIELDKKAAGQKGGVETMARERWKNNEDTGIGSCNESMQQKDAPAVDDSMLGTHIECLCEFDMDDKGTIKELRWCGGLVERICDGSWLIPEIRRKKYKVGQAADIFWDAISEADLGLSRCIVPLNPKKWNKTIHEAWRKDSFLVDK